MLTSKQRAYLRSLAVNEDTILMIGKGGIDGDVVKQAADAIFKRELIKGKVLETAPVSPREAAEALAEQTESEVVRRARRRTKRHISLQAGQTALKCAGLRRRTSPNVPSQSRILKCCARAKAIRQTP